MGDKDHAISIWYRWFCNAKCAARKYAEIDRENNIISLTDMYLNIDVHKFTLKILGYMNIWQVLSQVLWYYKITDI